MTVIFLISLNCKNYTLIKWNDRKNLIHNDKMIDKNPKSIIYVRIIKIEL